MCLTRAIRLIVIHEHTAAKYFCHSCGAGTLLIDDLNKIDFNILHHDQTRVKRFPRRP